MCLNHIIIIIIISSCRSLSQLLANIFYEHVVVVIPRFDVRISMLSAILSETYVFPVSMDWLLPVIDQWQWSGRTSFVLGVANTMFADGISTISTILLEI